MAGNIDNFIRLLPENYNCCHVAEQRGEKLSGGFFRGTKLNPGPEAHKHSYFAFVYLISGTGGYTDCFKRSYKLKPGSLFLRFPDKPYRIQMDNRNTWLEFAVAVPESLYESLHFAGIVDEKTTFIEAKLSLDVLRKATDFINSLDITGRPENTLLSYAMLLDVFHEILNSSRRKLLADDRDANMLKQARLLLGANLDRRMLVGHVAGKLGVGYEAFRKKFSKAYGISPKAYRVSRRLDKAEVLIRHTDMSIKEIAASLGYPNDSDFIRQYKKHRKSPPGKLMTDSGFCP